MEPVHIVTKSHWKQGRCPINDTLQKINMRTAQPFLNIYGTFIISFDKYIMESKKNPDDHHYHKHNHYHRRHTPGVALEGPYK